jgi:cardiolipin synthase A/B
VTTGWAVISALAAVWAIVMAIVIILERRSAAATLAWLLVLAFLPFLGLIVYRLIGPLRLERKKLQRVSGRRVVHDALHAFAQIESTSPEDIQLATVPLRAGDAAPLRAERLEIYLDGVSADRAIGEAIEEARHHIHLEYYIWEPDRIGTRLRDQLVARARAGVEVRLIADGTGCNHLGRRFLRPLRDAGVEIASRTARYNNGARLAARVVAVGVAHCRFPQTVLGTVRRSLTKSSARWLNGWHG